MGKLAVTTLGTHACPQSDGTTPHVGGNILQGSPTVTIEGQPVARVNDPVQCASPAPNMITSGSNSVFINGLPAAFVGSSTAHGGQVMIGGATSVFIG